MVGSVSCSFKREIMPYVPYEVWSWVLCWDRKWIYVVSHFVKKGTKEPRGYVLAQNGSIFSSIVGAEETRSSSGEKESLNGNASLGSGRAESEEGFGDIPDSAIYASGIVRYVVKAGRMTVHPVLLLEASNLLPPRPGGWISSPSPSNSETATEEESGGEGSSNEVIKEEEEEESPRNGAEWDWKKVEAENARGLKLARHLDALEGTHCEWSGDQWLALDRFRDLF
jgi:hypothetical protein